MVEKQNILMNLELFTLFTLAFGVMLFLIQRAEPKRRLVVALLMLIAAELIRRYAVYRDVNSEALFAFIVALVLNFLFWVLIGRYNPVGSSDNIQVLGMDD